MYAIAIINQLTSFNVIYTKKNCFESVVNDFEKQMLKILSSSGPRRASLVMARFGLYCNILCKLDKINSSAPTYLIFS